MNIVSASDIRYLPGLFVTWASILISNKNTSIDFYLLHDGIAVEALRDLESNLREISSGFSLKSVEIDVSTMSSFPDFFFDSKMPYARLLIPHLLNIDRVLYIDTDFLALRNLSDVWEFDLADNWMGVCEEYSYDDPTELSTFSKAYPHVIGHRYFNSGFLLLDLEKIRTHLAFEKCLRLLEQRKADCIFHDQTALNVIFSNKVSYLNPNVNYQLNAKRQFSIEQLNLFYNNWVNLHYVTSDKPWLRKNELLSHRLFSFFEGIFTQDEKKIKRAYSIWPVGFSALRNKLSEIRLRIFSILFTQKKEISLKLANDHKLIFNKLLKEAKSNVLIQELLDHLKESYDRK